MLKKDRLRIALENIELDLVVGVYPAEQRRAQPVILTVEIEAEALPSYAGMQEANLPDVIDYDQIYYFVYRDLPKLGPIALLETIAEHIIAFCWRDSRVQQVKVRLGKPQIYKSSAIAMVELTRSRPDTCIQNDTNSRLL